MKTRHFARYLLLAALGLTFHAVSAKEISLQHRGLILNAELELAEGKTIADGVILITHGALAHREMESITAFRTLLADQGYNTLAINLSLGLDNRHGMYDCKHTHRHRNEDAADEIDAWVNWLGAQGTSRVIVLGHSRGGAQTALYAAKRRNPLVKAAILMAPATADNNNAGTYLTRYGRALPPLLKNAEALASSDTLRNVGLLTCPDTAATVESFLSYYGSGALVDTPTLIPEIAVPTLVVVAGADEIVVDLDEKLASLADGKRVRMTVVEDADHMFRDLHADEAVEAIDAFLQSVVNH